MQCRYPSDCYPSIRQHGPHCLVQALALRGSQSIKTSGFDVRPLPWDGGPSEKRGKKNVGILVCGSGTGMCITANKHKNIRAAQCFSLKSTKLSRLHNDANVITLGSRILSRKNACSFVNVFLNTEFEGGRHKKRIRRI